MYKDKVRPGIKIITGKLNADISFMSSEFEACRGMHYVKARESGKIGIVSHDAPGALRSYAWIVKHDEGGYACYYHDEFERRV